MIIPRIKFAYGLRCPTCTSISASRRLLIRGSAFTTVISSVLRRARFPVRWLHVEQTADGLSDFTKVLRNQHRHKEFDCLRHRAFQNSRHARQIARGNSILVTNVIRVPRPPNRWFVSRHARAFDSVSVRNAAQFATYIQNLAVPLRMVAPREHFRTDA